MATYPIQFGQAFKQGDAQSPVCTQGGVAIPTQVNVMCRWPDNSVKFAIFSVVLTGNANDVADLGFAEGTALGTTPGTLVSFDAGIKIYNQTAVLKSQLSSVAWITGPICSVYIHANHTGGNDVTGISNSAAMRPIFHVAHW